MKKLILALMGVALCVSAYSQSTRITIDGRQHDLQLDRTHLLLNAYASSAEAESPYIATKLQDLGELSADRRVLTLPKGTTIYVAPGVYWTDETWRQGFPFDESGFVIDRPNVGLTILGDDITFVGLTDNPADAHIAGNRGEGGARGLGASGSWYTLAVSNGFSARNLTIANYAQQDLVYERDPSQNISKRIESTNHAEVMRGAEGAGLDRIHFENVHFTGYLNMMAGFSPARSYFKDCVLQCTDDALFGGHINVYENCTFRLFDSHPSFGGASAGGINALLNCRMEGQPQMTFPTLYMVKMSRGEGSTASSMFAIVDTHFSGRIIGVEWENVIKPDSRHLVYHNTIGEARTPLQVSPEQPQTSVVLTAEALRAFKVGNTYNVYNLLRGDDGWNPSGQTELTERLPYRFLVDASTKTLGPGGADVVLSPAVEPAGLNLPVVWNYDQNRFTGTADNTGKLTLRAKPNTAGKVVQTQATATLPNGLLAGATLAIYPDPVAAPRLSGASIAIGGGAAALTYALDHADYKDVSTIAWYREKSATSTDGILVGASRNDAAGLFMDAPQKNYTLGKYDVGYYLRAVVTPKYEFSDATAPIELRTSRAVAATDVRNEALNTDFKNIPLAVEDHRTTTGRWFFDRVAAEDAVAPWAWGVGSNGADGRWGLQNNRSVDSRLVFAQTGTHGDMTLTFDYSTGKVEGQGFGGSGCFLDVYIKYDPATRTGYGVRIERVPATTSGTQWTLYRYDGLTQTALTEGILSGAFMPGSTIKIVVEGNTLRVEASTRSAQTPLQVAQNLPGKASLSWTDASGALARNTFGGFGVRTRNSGGASYVYGNAGTNNCLMIHRIVVE